MGFGGGRMSPEKKERFEKDALIHKLQDMFDKAQKEMKWFENFAGAMYKLDKDMYDKASKIAYEMLKAKKEE